MAEWGCGAAGALSAPVEAHVVTIARWAGCHLHRPFPARLYTWKRVTPVLRRPFTCWVAEGSVRMQHLCAEECNPRWPFPPRGGRTARGSHYLGSVHGYHHEQNSVPKASDLLGCMAERGTIRHRPAVVRSVSWTEERVGNAVAPLPLAARPWPGCLLAGTPGPRPWFWWGGCCVRH